MTHTLKNVFSALSLTATLAASVILSGCGGGGGGGNSTPRATPIPSPFDASYRARFTPTDAIPADGQAPTGNLSIVGSRASLQATFFLQDSVVAAVQKVIDDGLRANNVGSAIPDNQAPVSILFNGSGQLDGSGKLVLTSRKTVDVCGTAILTIDPTFTSDGTTTSGVGTYQITFPNTLTIVVRGRTFNPAGTCNNLPLRSGTLNLIR